LEIVLQYRFGLTEDQVQELSDDRFLNLAAQAEIIKELETEAVRDGVLKALANIKFEE
jgi:putative IMPACT (imprinted ancient) family translation regulator